MEMPEISNPLPDHIELAENKFFTKKSIITFLMIGIVLLAIPFSVKFLQQTNILKTRATGDEITFVAGDNISCDEAGVCKATDTKFQVLLKSPLGPPGVTLLPPQNLKATCSGDNNSVTLTWDVAAEASYYLIRMNKDPENDWTGPGDLGINTASTSYTTGVLTGIASACSWGTSHADQHCTDCANQQSTCTATGVNTNITKGVNYGWSVQVYPNTGPSDRRTGGVSFTCGTSSSVTPLPASKNLKINCGANNTSATFSWDAVPGASSYILRANKEPFDVWKPTEASSGDFAPGVSTTSTTQTITPGANYDWNVQPIEPGEQYPYKGMYAGGGTVHCP